MRDAERARGDSWPRTFGRWAVTLFVAGAAAWLGAEASDRAVVVALVTVAGTAIGYLAAWSPALVHAAARPTDRTAHWISQVYQAEPGTVEFDLWSQCDHEIAGLRAEVIEPEGAIVRSVLEHQIDPPRMAAGEYRGIGNYPQRFATQAQLEDDSPYAVVWFGRRTPRSPWIEIARQPFTTPVPNGKVVQAADHTN